MAILATYACPGANGHPPHQFEYFHHPNKTEDPAPRFCPRCGWDSQAGDDDGVVLPFKAGIVAPHVRAGMAKAKFDSANQTYRQMEEGSRDMAYQAGEQSGEDESHMRITNLKDNLREGDIAAVDIPKNEVSKLMDQAPQVTGFQPGTNAQAYGQAAHTGFAPRAGANAAVALTNFHSAHGQAMVKAAETKRY